ncbi:MAG TPA: ABC transporter substrate-binding protein [Chloroflexota bacterium]|nr:ABC transporter substrate-binding protein [Chloroflexota bacterium]
MRINLPSLALVAGLLLAGACGAPATPRAAQAPASGGAPTGSAPAAPASEPRSPALQAVVDGARAEGTFNLVWSDSSYGGADGIQRIVDTLNRRYGLNLNVQFTPGPSMPEMGVRAAQELAAGRPASSDVYLGREANVKALLEKSVLTPIDWPSLSPNIQPDMVAPANVAVEVAVTIAGLTYNTNLVPPAKLPQTSADLLLPEWKGRIAGTPYATFFDILGSPQLWGPERTVSFTRQFADNVGGLLRCGESERIISGEFSMLVFDCGGMDARVWSRKGAPVSHAILSDAAALLYYYVGVPKNAAHPNAATLFILESLTREGQDILWDTWGLDHVKVPGSHSKAEVDEAEARGAKFVEANVQFMMSYPEQETVRKQTQEILARAGQ